MAEADTDVCAICSAEDPPGTGGRRRQILWVQCDGAACGRWFHATCLRVAPAEDDEWLCDDCIAALPDEDEDLLDPNV